VAPKARRSGGPARREPGSARLRRQLVEQLEGNGCLANPGVRRAFLTVPRERFLPEITKREGLERVYQDQAIVTSHDDAASPRAPPLSRR
jgi:protein-L-isoaspartate O-methyltransferase